MHPTKGAFIFLSILKESMISILEYGSQRFVLTRLISFDEQPFQ